MRRQRQGRGSTSDNGGHLRNRKRRGRRGSALPGRRRGGRANDLPCVFLGAVEISPGAASAILSLTYAQCRFPIGEPGSEFFAFCTETREERKAYCAHHNRIVEPVTKKRTRPLGHVGFKTMNSHSSTTSLTWPQAELLPTW